MNTEIIRDRVRENQAFGVENVSSFRALHINLPFWNCWRKFQVNYPFRFVVTATFVSPV